MPCACVPRNSTLDSMPLGLPVPSDLDSLSIDELQELHDKWEGERVEIRAKKLAIKGTLDAKHAVRDAAKRAGFDTVIGLGKKAEINVSPQTAKEMLASAAAGALSLSKAMADKLKQIAGIN
jgi:hypothetical protein